MFCFTKETLKDFLEDYTNSLLEELEEFEEDVEDEECCCDDCDCLFNDDLLDDADLLNTVYEDGYYDAVQDILDKISELVNKE